MLSHPLLRRGLWPHYTEVPGGDGGTLRIVERVPGTKGQPHTTIEGGGHFLQEGRGELFAGIVADFVKSSPRPA